MAHPRLHQDSHWTLVVASITSAVLRYAHGLITDDAFITFRYARNLVEGHGLVFNPGELVYGTTTPLYACFIAAGMLTGIAPWHWVFATDCIFTVVILWRLLEIFRAADSEEWFPLLAALLVVGTPLTMAVPGMETQCFMAAMFSALSALARGGAPWKSTSWASLAAMIRPEGLIVLLVVLVFATARAPSRGDWKLARRAMLPVIVYLIWQGTLAAYYGDVVPHSLRAKRLLFSGSSWDKLLVVQIVKDFAIFLSQPHGLGFLMIAGLWHCGRLEPLRPLLLCFALLLGFYAVGSATVDYLWYRTPLYVMMFCFAVLGVAQALRWAASRAPGLVPAKMSVSMGALLLVLLCPMQLYILGIMNGRALRDFSIITNGKAYQQCAEYIRKLDARPEIAGYEVGALGYFSEGRLFDLVGLMTPEVVAARSANPRIDPLSLSTAPWFVHPFWHFELPGGREEMERRAVRYGYVPVAEFSWEWDGPGVTVIYHRDSMPAVGGA